MKRLSGARTSSSPASPAGRRAPVSGSRMRTLATALSPGAPVRQEHLRKRQWFDAGDTVRVHAVGPGFTIQGEGVAITPGIEGQSARIRTESGRTITGKPVGQRLAEVQL